jgi:hypothetical protein
VEYNITELTEGQLPVASLLIYTMTIGINFPLHHCTNVSVLTFQLPSPHFMLKRVVVRR